MGHGNTPSGVKTARGPKVQNLASEGTCRAGPSRTEGSGEPRVTEPDFFRIVTECCARACVELQGDIDGDEAQRLVEVLVDLVVRVRRVDVDVAAVTFFGSAALTALVTGLLAAREAGHRLHLVSLTEPIRRLLDITGLTDELAPGAAAS